MELNSFQLLGLEIGLVIIGLILIYRASFLKKDNMICFFKAILCLNLSLVINIPLRMLELHLVQMDAKPVFWLYAVYIMLMTFMLYFWVVFALKQLNSKLVDTPLKEFLYMLPALAMIPICIINKWTGWLYFIDSNSWYNRGSIFILQSLVSYLYFILIFIVNTIHFIKGNDKEAVKICYISLVPSIVGFVLQNLFGGSFLLLGCVVCGWLMYIGICLNRQKAYELSEAVSKINDELVNSNKEIANNMRTILALSDIYHIMYDVNLDKDTFTEIKAPKMVSDFCSQFTSARECLGRLPSAMFDAAYINVMENLYNPYTISDRLRNTNSCFADAIGRYTRGWLRTSIVVTERAADGRVIRVVFCLQNVDELVRQQKLIDDALMHEQHVKEMKELFYGTAEALASAIDAKDRYTHGHSVRVANYSKRLAALAGMSEKECDDAYLAGLLHDVGKIGIDDSIINKKGGLTDEEYNQIKKHPEYGKQILDKIERHPYLSEAANFHHERYDGKGYPKGLKGTDIPVMARIVAVADAYDTMTSKRTYRGIVAQQQVREQMVMGIGTQFDPVFAKLFIGLIDEDYDYSMKESHVSDKLSLMKVFKFNEYLSYFSNGLRVTTSPTTLTLRFKVTEPTDNPYAMVSLIFYDSFDAIVHIKDSEREEFHFHEYLTIRADGFVITDEIRKIEVMAKPDNDIDSRVFAEACRGGMDVEYELARFKDHMRIRLRNPFGEYEYIVAIKDGIRYAYAAITGESCEAEVVSVIKAPVRVSEGDIPRIAEEINFAQGPQGDLPNLQVDSWCAEYTPSVEVSDGLTITMHSLSLPTARLIWHCPYIILFYSDNGQIKGPGYAKYAHIRMDGESVEDTGRAQNKYYINKSDEFVDWDNWKARNKAGVDCEISIERKGNNIVTKSINAGLEVINTTSLPTNADKVYIAFTGDQVAMTNINIIRNK